MWRHVGCNTIASFLVCSHLAFAGTLTFNSPVSGTIADAFGNGTGFTDRLPGTGMSLPVDDPNLDITSSPGTLRLASTHADLNSGGHNLGNLEAPGVLLNNVVGKDLSISALFTYVNVPNGSDQLMLYAGVSSSQSIRAGFHETNTFLFIENNGGNDVLTFNQGAGSFAPGDDVVLTLSRQSGFWRIAWQNLTNPSASGSSPPIGVPWLDPQSLLYVGVTAQNAGSLTSQTAQVQFFSCAVLPEPTTIVLAGLGIGILMCNKVFRVRRGVHSRRAC